MKACWLRRAAWKAAIAGLAIIVGAGTTLSAANAVPETAVGEAVAGPNPTRNAMHLLKKECFSCHNQNKQKGGLVMTSREALLKGSDSGEVVAEGNPDGSLLAKALLADADPHMPPKKQLAEPEIELLRQWIQDGMRWDEVALAEDDAVVAKVELSRLPASYQPVLALALAPDAKRLAVARGGSIVLHDAEAEKYPVLQAIEAHRDAVQSLAWSADGRWLASGAFRRVALWNDTFKLDREWTEGLTGRITALQFSPDSSKLVLADGVAGRSGFVRVINVADGKVLDSWRAHDDTIFALDFSHDGTRIVTAGGDKLIRVWALSPRKELAQLEGHGAQVLSIAFNPTATQVVSGGADKELNVWDVQTREKVISLGAHTAAISGVSWPGNGKTIIASTSNGGVFTYADLKVHSGEQKSKGGEEKKVGETAETFLCVTSTPSGKTIFAGGHDGTVQVWSHAGKLLAKLAAPTEPELNPAAHNVPGDDVSAQLAGITETPRTKEVTTQPTISFIRDVLPALSRAGCTTSSCHAKAEGQNGFKLSVFSYDPKSDYEAIVKSARGRRVFPAAPDQSLIIQKPTTAIEHEGGKRFEPGSELHQLLVRWIAEGMEYRVANEPTLRQITVSPQDRRYQKTETQPLAVVAHFSDGSQRNVTHLAAYASNDAEMAAVSEEGVIKVGTLSGQAVVVARYMGFVADAQILVPADKLLPAAVYAALPQNNFIDKLAYAQFQQLGLLPSELCSDTEFLRRAKLDTIGVLPTPEEVRAFLADPSPDKRREVTARFLEDPAYADYWANKWADLVRPNPDRVGLKSVFTLDQWLRQSFRENKPYDQFVREILLAEGTNHRDGPAVIYRDRREAADLTTMFGQLFLGTRLECAKCHNHPNEKWTQNDFYQFAAFFGTVKQKGAGISPPISAGTETFYFATGGTVKHPVTGEVMSPRPLDGPYKPAPKGTDPRRALADSLTSPANPLFARAAVNRVWANFFGRGMVEPVDDFRTSNPSVNPALLTALAEDFIQHGYGFKHLIRRIVESRLYQLSSTPNDYNLKDTRNFSRAYRRRLPAEVLLDAVNDATGAADIFAGMPPGTRATQAWSYKIESQFMDAFNRPDPSMDPPCERDTHISVVQSLHLMNSKAIQAKLSSSSGRVHELVKSKKSPEEIVHDLYLTTLNRLPSEEEVSIAKAAFAAEQTTRQIATEDIFWALLNSPEFVFNH